MRRFLAYGVFCAAVAAVEILREGFSKPKPQKDRDPSELQVSCTPLPNGKEYVRLRGSYHEIMDHLGVEKKSERPPLPKQLDIEALPSYHGGCPHCGKISLYGEGTWRYQELSRTRSYLENTTTYLAKCRNCHGFMKSTIDHDDR